MTPKSYLSHISTRSRLARRAGWMALALGLTGGAQAVDTLYWDVSGAGVIFTGAGGPTPSGAWSTSVYNWNSESSGAGLLTGSAWTNGSNAVFSAGSDATGAYTVTISGNMSAASVTIKDGTPAITGGTLTLGSGGFTVNTSRAASVSSILAGTSGLMKAGSGTLTLSGTTANTYSGGTTVSDGTVILAKSAGVNAVGTDNVTIGDGAGTATSAVLRLNASNQITDTLSVAVASDGQFQLNGYSETVRTVSGTGSISLATGSQLTLNDTGSSNYAGQITGSGALVKQGSGTVTLSGSTANTFSGALSITDGTVLLAKNAGVEAIGAGATITVGDNIGAASSAVLRLTASNQISDTAGAITVNSDGVLSLNGFTDAITAITGYGAVDLGTNGFLTVGANSGASLFGGTISGTGVFELTGAGSLVLQSSLVISDELRLSGGTLYLSGWTLTAQTLHVTGNSTIDFSNGNGVIDATRLIIDAGVTLTVTNWIDAADYFFARNWDGAVVDVRGVAPTSQVVFANTSGSTVWQSYDKQITPVPEPSTYGLMFMGGLGAFFGWRRWRGTKQKTAVPVSEPAIAEAI